jgi:aquaporin NIP
MQSDRWKKYTAEILGTFALVFFGTGAIVMDQESGGLVTHVGISLAFGLVVATMIYAFGDISGAHLNPAVSLAFAAAKAFPVREIFPYILSQVTGAVLASVVLHLLFPQNEFLGSTIPSGSLAQSFIMEIILSFFLMLVIIHVATGSREQGMFAGLAIGGTVMLEALVGGPVSGASMNPARSLAPAMVSGNWNALGIYMVAPVLGMLLAVGLWRFMKK